MARQIFAPGHSGVALEHRVAVLEQQVNALTEAVHELAAALEAAALDPPDDGGTAPTTRRTHALVLLPPLTDTHPR